MKNQTNKFIHNLESIDYLIKEIKELKNEIQKIKNEKENKTFHWKKMSLYERIQFEFLEFTSMTSMNCLHFIFKSKKIISKILWSTFILITGVLFFLTLSNYIKDYKNYDVITEIETIYQNTLIFPTITICSDDKNFSSFYIESCNFSISTNCTNLHEEYKFAWLNCLEINGGKNSSKHSVKLLESFFGGPFYGLKLNIISKIGYVYIYIHDFNVKPKFINTGSLIAIARHHTSISIRKRIEKKLPEPYSDCLEDLNSYGSLPFRYIIESNITYTRDYCLYNCTLMFIEDFCNCSFDEINEKSSCVNEIILCNITEQKISSLKKKCEILCPQECNITTYLIYNSYTYYDDKNIKESTINIKIFFDELSYESIQQSEKINPSEYPLMIFSTFGSFFGISVLTVFEIMGFILEIFFILFE
jgi:hypothetical protein